MSKQKRKPKAKEPFWKQFSPEVKSITDHVGKFVDQLKSDDLVNLALYGSLAYLGYKAWGTNKTRGTETYISGYERIWHEGHWKYPINGEPWERVWISGYYEEKPIYATRAILIETPKSATDTLISTLVGPIGLKLATTTGGTPPLSQIAGLATLAALGLVTAIPQLSDLLVPDVTGVPALLSGLGPFGVGHLGIPILTLFG